MSDWKPAHLSIGGPGPFDAPGWYAVRTVYAGRSTATCSFRGPFKTRDEAQAACDQENEADAPRIRTVPPELKT